jgi:hypothetical protein
MAHGERKPLLGAGFLRSAWWLILVGSLLSVQLLAALLLPKSAALSTISDLIQCALLFACYFSTLPNQIQGRGRENAFWTLMSISFSLWLLMQVLWSLYEVVLRKEVPALFWGDIVLFLHTVPMMIALTLLPHLQSSARKLARDVVDAALLAVCCVYFYAAYVLTWQYIVPSEAAYNANFNIVYGAANVAVVLLAGICCLRTQGGWARLYGQWFGASLLYCISSYLASTAIDEGHYYSGSLYDLPLVLTLAWFASIGFLARDRRHSREVKPYVRSSDAWGKSLMLACASAVIAAAASQIAGAGVPGPIATFRLWLTVSAMGVIIGLMLARFIALGGASRSEEPKMSTSAKWSI